MEKFEVIIIGAGIAGCGLAYNLKKLGYGGSILIVDKNKIGSNTDCGYRNTFKEVIKEYNLPYFHKYEGIKIGANDQIFFSLKEPFYFVDYNKICNHLILRADAEYRNEEVLDVKESILLTNRGEYRFRYLIDCSGSGFFLRNKLNFMKPFVYYIGETKIIKSKEKISDKYFFCTTNTSGYVEDLYPLKNMIIQGNWQITDKIDFNLIKVPEKNLLNKYVREYEVVKTSKAVDPISPVFPLVYKNYAFLGDSFGNASSVGEGLRPILEASKLLSEAIIKDDLNDFGKSWKKMNLDKYTKCLISKYETKTDHMIVRYLNKSPSKEELFEIFKGYPDLFLGALKNEVVHLPKEALRKCPINFIFRRAVYYAYLKLKYARMQIPS
jgi:flavin-dependent dehydrogenase